MARSEQDRLDELSQRQLRYAAYAWQPPTQGGERRADDDDAESTDSPPTDTRMVIEVRAELPADAAEVHAVVAATFDDETVAALWEDLAARPRAASYVAGQIDGDSIRRARRPVVGLGRHPRAAGRRQRAQPAQRVAGVSASRRGACPGGEGDRGGRRRRLARPVPRGEDPDYYGRLGFEPAAKHGFTPPSPRVPLPAFQCMLLSAYEPFLAGGLVYPENVLDP